MGNMPDLAADVHGPTRTSAILVSGEQVGGRQGRLRLR